MKYDDVYSRYVDYFGPEPDKLLVDYLHLLDRTHPALDIGAGQGRNALFLATRGISVHAIDPSATSIEIMKTRAAAENLPLHAAATGLETFHAGSKKFSGILLFGVIQDLQWDSIRLLLDRLPDWCAKNTLVFVTAHATSDPGYARFAAGKRLGKNSFEDESGRMRTFLEPGEILELFRGYDVVHHWEGMGPVHSHGDGPEERHAVIRAVFRPDREALKEA